ncbi:DUF2118 domain-containing protein [Tissierella sp.]|uniref:DUF2118 domain-containing protein n=1 Tax=Tissierella sp. TaxID=41274 RepID=UPI0028643C80|nr:DUF2118 domain-containing protein [Tissierella sp.]MDR7855688.1 biotin/lipoyl-containing protein [Tissierella sp.]
MRKFMINVNGNSYEVEVEEIVGGVAQKSVATTPTPVAPKAAPAQVAPTVPAPKVEKKEVVVSAGQEVIEAPMPGTILRVDVKEGDTVKAGDILLILEAMKMENEIVAPRDGVIAAISASTGNTVNTGDKLVVLD